MRQPFTFWIAMRYLRARSHAAFISFVSSVSMLGIGLAVAVLIIVMAVVNGFETELERRLVTAVDPEDWDDARAEAWWRNHMPSRQPAAGRDGEGLKVTMDLRARRL